MTCFINAFTWIFFRHETQCSCGGERYTCDGVFLIFVRSARSSISRFSDNGCWSVGRTLAFKLCFHILAILVLAKIAHFFSYRIIVFRKPVAHLRPLQAFFPVFVGDICFRNTFLRHFLAFGLSEISKLHRVFGVNLCISNLSPTIWRCYLSKHVREYLRHFKKTANGLHYLVLLVGESEQDRVFAFNIESFPY